MSKLTYSIAFIESNTTGTGEEFILSALKNNFEVLFFTSTPEKYNFLRKLLIYPILIDTADIGKLYNYLKNITNLKGVFSSSERFIYNASEVAKRLFLPHSNTTSIQNCRDKFCLTKLLTAANLQVPKTRLINSLDQASNIYKEFDFPVIAKPNLGTGSVGVKLCLSQEEINQHINTLTNNNNGVLDILIQDYVIGEEFSVELVALGDKYHFFGITKKYLTPEPYFIEIGHQFPAPLDEYTKNRIFEYVIKTLQAVGFTFGPAHVELRLTEKGISMIEINPRLAGGMIPVLIEQSQGIRLIEGLIKLYTGQKPDFRPKSSLTTAIKFFLPEQEGFLRKVYGIEKVRKHINIVAISLYKAIGDKITIKNDFNDRLGFIIAKGANWNECNQAITEVFNSIKFEIDNNLGHIFNNYGRNRLGVNLDPKIKLLLEERIFKDLNELELLSDIDKAHIIMLSKCKIISKSQLYLILNTINDLEKTNFIQVRKIIEETGIGDYFAYEQYLVNKLGIKTAGVIHTGRSRNDINATLTRLKSRKVFSKVYSALWNLRAEILQVAAISSDIVMPIYSQYQPAIPATYSYYLLAIESGLARNQYLMKQIIGILNTSTLGAVSGGGTTFPIDLTITAKLLGFDHILHNALDTIANRDLELMLLSNGAILGVTISRIAQDYQLWSTQEFAFFDLPNNICGVSSAMPQKKNPYLLEKIKGKAINISGQLFSSLAAMQKTPFFNSLEVSTEALKNFTESFEELIKSISLLEIIIHNAKPITQNMINSNVKGLTVATVISDLLARNHNLSIREAHNLVGKTICEAINRKQNPLNSILALTKVSVDPTEWHLQFNYGKGAGSMSVEHMMKEAIDLLKFDGVFFHYQSKKWLEANELLKREVEVNG